MKISKKQNGNALTMALEGRLDTLTAPEFEAEILSLEGIEDLTLDFSKLEYISSAGLRVLLLAQKAMYGKGKMTVTNINKLVREVFEVTGFLNILNVQ